jgi:hypothetical protein
MASIPNMLELIPSASRRPIPFAGADYSPERDRARLTKQIHCILDVASDGAWRTVQRLTADCRKRFPAVGFPENSVQAQLRNLRKLGYTVDRRNVAESGVLYEYRLVPKEGAAQ